MKTVINYPVKVFATDFIVLVFMSLLLCYVRSMCETALLEGIPYDVRSIEKSPSGLVPERLENDPNVNKHSQVTVKTRDRKPLSYGILEYFWTKIPGGPRSNVYFFISDEDNMYFDRKSGLIVHNFNEEMVMPDKRTTDSRAQYYVGPEGISRITRDGLGRFIEPIVDQDWFFRVERVRRALIIYDKKLRRFFKVDFAKGQVTKGPELTKNYNRYKPSQIGRLEKILLSFPLSLDWKAPQIKINKEDMEGRVYGGDYQPVIPHAFQYEAGLYIVVLDKSGLIYLLDKESLEFAKIDGRVIHFGRLPSPESYFGHRNRAIPDDLLGYKVLPLSLTTHFFEENPEFKKEFFGEPYVHPSKPLPSRIERKYLGMMVASLSRDGTALALSVFDEKGERIESGGSAFSTRKGQPTSSYRSSKAVFFEPPWASTYTAIKYFMENLHPPILSLCSYYTAYSFEATSGHRGLFFLPNSFIAMWGRERSGNFVERFLSALWWITPSIILAIWLATRVNKDAVVFGLSDNVRLYWILGTVAFGLAAYITYRLTKPKMTLVTCQNCGLMRRPDMHKCHRCKSDWFVPELTPPAWRVLNGAEQPEQLEQANENPVTDAEIAEDTEGAEETTTE
jgi:hypothetical protein